MSAVREQRLRDDPDLPAVSVQLDRLIIEAAREVDHSLLDWALSLSPRERLRACSNATRALGRFTDAASRTR